MKGDKIHGGTDELSPTNMAEHTVTNRDNERLSVRQIRKNVAVVSMVLTMLFTSYNGLGNLQSSLHIDQGMGVVNQAILHVCMIISSLFLPTITIRKLGHKTTLTLSALCYVIWMLANGHAVWVTMVPASIFVGLCAGPLWTAQSSYFSILSREYGRLNNESPKAALAIFFGIFHAIFPFNGIFGSTVSAIVLKPKDANYSEPSETALRQCGMNDCPSFNTSNVNYEKTSTHVLWTLVGTYLAIALSALVIGIIFIDPIPSYLMADGARIATKRVTLNSVCATIKHLGRVNQILLIGLSSYNGFKSSFQGAEYNKSWVTCHLGIWMVGWVSIPFSVAFSLSSLCSGRMVKYTGRIPIFITGFCVDFIVILTLLLWQPDSTQIVVLFMIPALSGVADGLRQVQVAALYGDLFPQQLEPAYSNNGLWMATGFTLGFGYSAILCTPVKLYIVLGVLVAAVFGYVVIELREAIKKKKSRPISEISNREDAITNNISLLDKSSTNIRTCE